MLVDVNEDYTRCKLTHLNKVFFKDKTTQDNTRHVSIEIVPRRLDTVSTASNIFETMPS